MSLLTELGKFYQTGFLQIYRTYGAEIIQLGAVNHAPVDHARTPNPAGNYR